MSLPLPPPHQNLQINRAVLENPPNTPTDPSMTPIGAESPIPLFLTLAFALIFSCVAALAIRVWCEDRTSKEE